MISLTLAVASMLHDLTLATSYVNQSFPQPLNKEQEKLYFERWMTGDRDAYQALIKHNLRLVAHVAKKFDSSGIDHDDLISIGTVGLIKAVETFQPTKGTKFATYAARCIQNEILMQLRALKKTRRDISLNSPIGTDKEGNESAYAGYLCNDKFYFVPNHHGRRAMDVEPRDSYLRRHLVWRDVTNDEVMVGQA